MGKQDEPSAKIGAGHAAAMFRQGVRELRASVYPESNVAQPGELGLFGTKTPGEVAEARRGEEVQLEEETKHENVLADWLKEAGQDRDIRGREPNEPEMDR